MTTGLRILLPRPLMKGRIALGVALLVLSNIPSGATCLGLRPLTSRYDGAPAAGKKRMRRRDPCVHIYLDSRRGALVIRRRGSSLGRSEYQDRTPVRDSHRCIWKPALAVVAGLTSALTGLVIHRLRDGRQSSCRRRTGWRSSSSQMCRLKGNNSTACVPIRHTSTQHTRRSSR